MKINESTFRRILREEAASLYENEGGDSDNRSEIHSAAQEAKQKAEKYGLEGINWDGLITTIVGSGVSGALKLTGAGAPVGLAIDAAMLVKAILNLIQASRAQMELNKFLSEEFDVTVTGRPGSLWSMDRPIPRSVLREVESLPEDKKQRIRSLLVTMVKKSNAAFISFLNASPDEVISGSVALISSVAGFEEMILSMSQLSGEIIESMPGLEKFLSKDEALSGFIYSIGNRIFMTNIGMIATAVGLLDPVKDPKFDDVDEEGERLRSKTKKPLSANMSNLPSRTSGEPRFKVGDEVRVREYEGHPAEGKISRVNKTPNGFEYDVVQTSKDRRLGARIAMTDIPERKLILNRF
jgi:hypothetical protein